MKPLSLTLKGFRGIRDGLGRDELTLDFETLADGAQLIAIAGANGRGKSTVMDNATPYTTLPSRAAVASPGGFSYYDHLYLPESEKDLVWSHEGQRYRSQLVFRINGKRRTEAYLFQHADSGWQPVELPDGTVSDGKVETYERCVEAILGSAETFFTSVFSAQGKRPLSAYKNAEIKNLLADLLGLDEIQKLGQQASETAKFLKTGLATLRHEQTSLANAARQIDAEQIRLSGAIAQMHNTVKARQAAQQALDTARTTSAQRAAERQVAEQTEIRRRALAAERNALAQADGQARQALEAQDARERQRLALLEQRVAARAEQGRQRRVALKAQRDRLETVLSRALAVDRAGRRRGLSERVVTARSEHIAGVRQAVGHLMELKHKEKAALQTLTSVERDAGQASLKAAELARRFGLTGAVPCVGTDLQGRCQLLGDAHQAKTLIPSAEARIAQLVQMQGETKAELAAIRAQIMGFVDSPARLEAAERRLAAARARATRLAVLAAQVGEIEQARATFASLEREWASLEHSAAEMEAPEDAEEREQIRGACQAIAKQRARQAEQHKAALQRIDVALAALPAPYNEQLILAAERAVEWAASTLAAAEQAFLTAVQDAQTHDIVARQATDLAAQQSALALRIATVEKELGAWTLFAKCLSHDGVIALAIDEAGPALAGLANDLLLACYGPRFTVSIKTLVETGKGERREGFDIVAHDAESGEAKSVGLMSGGERLQIEAALTRAIALYLAQNTGRRYATLFSDEADGSLDPERKRMFMAMKREVLRLGGYEQEYFVSQTPELTAMADAVIDLDEMADHRRDAIKPATNHLTHSAL